MALAYTAPVPRPHDLPAHLVVRVYVARDDGGKLSADDLEALARVYPQTDESERKVVEASIARARTRTPRSKVAKPAPSKQPRAKSPTPKRKAAKKPTRARTRA